MSCRRKHEGEEQNLALASAFPNKRLDRLAVLKCSARDQLLAFSSSRRVSSPNKQARYSLCSPAHTPLAQGRAALPAWPGKG